MTFNKILFILPIVTISSIAMEACSSEKEMLEKIPDVSKILPPIEKYIEKMKDVVERYKNVYNEISDTDATQRIENVKNNVLDFYSSIFGVKLSVVERYRKNFTTEEYLTWVAKESINRGNYEFATNEDELFDACVNYEIYNEKYYDNQDFNSTSTTKFPNPENIPEYFKVYVPYNQPYFEAFLVHETGHILDYAYRVLFNIRNKTMDLENNALCQDAVSVFFETMYTIKNDQTLMLHRFTDLYSISFKQKYIAQIKALSVQDKLNAPERYKKIIMLSDSGIENYSTPKYFGKLTPEQFMKNIEKKHPELSFIYDCWKMQVNNWKLTDFPTSIIANSTNIASDIRTILNIYKTGNVDFYDVDKIYSYANYIPHVYRTLKLSDNLKSSKNVLERLDKIVRNVPDIMSTYELKDLISILGL